MIQISYNGWVYLHGGRAYEWAYEWAYIIGMTMELGGIEGSHKYHSATDPV